MGTLRFADLQTRPTEVLDLTSRTVKELRQLVPPFEAAFQAHMAHWRLDAKPRTARRRQETLEFKLSIPCGHGWRASLARGTMCRSPPESVSGVGTHTPLAAPDGDSHACGPGDRLAVRERRWANAGGSPATWPDWQPIRCHVGWCSVKG
jgi:hypothetical protein